MVVGKTTVHCNVQDHPKESFVQQQITSALDTIVQIMREMDAILISVKSMIAKVQMMKIVLNVKIGKCVTKQQDNASIFAPAIPLISLFQKIRAVYEEMMYIVYQEPPQKEPVIYPMAKVVEHHVSSTEVIAQQASVMHLFVLI